MKSSAAILMIFLFFQAVRAKNDTLSNIELVTPSIILTSIKNVDKNHSDSSPSSTHQQQLPLVSFSDSSSARSFSYIPVSCNDVSILFQSRGIKASEIPEIPINETSLRFCEKSFTCCTTTMEAKLERTSKINLEKDSKNHILKLHQVLVTKAQNYSDSFGDLLALSKREFHSMFQRTYGIIYEQNAYVFADLFGELEKYYLNGRVDLVKSMDSFFNKLYQKMFTVLNAQYSFDERYLTCVSDHMKELKPFGDVPDKLSIQIKRAFVATRTYVTATTTAANVLKRMTPIRLNSDCINAVSRMQQCSLCSGYVQKPCQNYCVNVIKGCFDFFNELDIEWNNFVNSMDSLAERLLGSFNIVMVVEPINIKISEAIMNFQESGSSITSKIFQGCGRPKLQKRGRRSVDDIDFYVTAEDTKLLREIREASPRSRFVDYDDTNERKDRSNKKNKDKGHNNQNKKRKNDDNENKNNMPSLEKSIKEIKQKLKESKKFWSTLPYHICNNTVQSATTDESTNCWNGKEVGTYKYPITDIPNSIKNPEFDKKLSTPRQTSAVATEIYYLKIAIENLKKAYVGEDVTWTETDKFVTMDKGPIDDDDFDIISGYGSGDGSGETLEPTTSSSTPKPSSLVPSTERPPTFNPSSDDIDSSEPTNKHDTTKKPKKSGAQKKETMSLRKALFLFLFPIYMTWFGVIFD